jgi:hypothetical protein
MSHAIGALAPIVSQLRFVVASHCRRTGSSFDALETL